MLSRTDFDQLLQIDAGPAVSIYLPTHPAGREVRQDPIRLKNRLTEAAERLAAGARPAAARDLLAPAQQLVEDGSFWRHRDVGLALFLAPGFCRHYSVPIAVPEEVVVGSRFHVRPLAPLFEGVGPYWLLTVSAGRARLWEGTRDRLIECPDCKMPEGVAEVASETVYEETHHAGLGGRSALAKAQPLGDAPDELRKTELVEYLRRVAAAVEPPLKRRPAPLILAARPDIRGNFRRLAGWKELLEEGIAENPDALAAPELERRARAILERKASEERDAALNRLNALLGSADPRAASRVEDIVAAARDGRVARLFIAGDDHVWGALGPPGELPVVHDGAADGDIDLLDYAVLMTLRQGGAVSSIDRAALPAGRPAAALLRY